ncbi:EAL domain-containing protein [Enterobacter sp. UNJFSC 003]|uniref:EAL domain-containing protein n=1 Tax=Enterobacter sp. UNJFSC 003 TaxID=3122077 RepID=UPI002EC99D4A|nr:EAL domain-containing protein [Serratia liquefaciens]
MTAHNQTYTPPRLQHVSQDLTGIKLEPIVALPALRPVGAEVLSMLSPQVHSERFFRDQSAAQSLMLLEAQLAALKNTSVCNNLFINLPITVITVQETFQRLLQLKSPPLNIEIVEPATFLSLPGTQRECVVRRLQHLTMIGHRLWLDDVDEALVRAFLCCRLPLSGVKIDKIAFWRLRTTPALGELVALCSRLAANVLIEGIETDSDLAFALQAGAGLGQGYFWPSWTWPED